MWTDQQVQSRLVEATDTLRRLPDHNPLYSSRTFWPEIRKQPQQDWPTPTRVKTGPPRRDHIDRYLETLDWLRFIETKKAERDRDLVFWTCFCQYGEPRERISNWDHIRARSRIKLPNNDRHCRRLYSNAISIISGNLTVREYSACKSVTNDRNYMEFA